MSDLGREQGGQVFLTPVAGLARVSGGSQASGAPLCLRCVSGARESDPEKQRLTSTCCLPVWAQFFKVFIQKDFPVFDFFRMVVTFLFFGEILPSGYSKS